MKEKRHFLIVLFVVLLAIFSVGTTVWWVISNEEASLCKTDVENLGIIVYPNSILREVAQPVEIIGREEKELAQLMIDIVKKKDSIVGVSAPPIRNIKKDLRCKTKG